MTTTPSVLLLHDGELDDVRELLDQLGADYLHFRGGEIPEIPLKSSKIVLPDLK